MADIFDEVEENIREEKWKEWFRRFAPFGAAVVVLVVAVVAGREWQQSRKAALAAETSENYVALTAAIDARNWDEARALAETIRQSGHRGYAGFAAQMEAEAALQAGAPDIAIENLQAAAGQMPLPALADLALLKAAYLQENEGNAQAATAIAQDLASAGRPLRATQRNFWQPWRSAKVASMMPRTCMTFWRCSRRRPKVCSAGPPKHGLCWR